MDWNYCIDFVQQTILDENCQTTPLDILFKRYLRAILTILKNILGFVCLFVFWKSVKINWACHNWCFVLFLKRHFFIFLRVYIVILSYMVANKMCCWEHDKSSLFISQFWEQLFLKQLKEIKDKSDKVKNINWNPAYSLDVGCLPLCSGLGSLPSTIF